MVGESFERLIGFAKGIRFLVCAQTDLHGGLHPQLLQHECELGVGHQGVTANGCVDAIHQLGLLVLHVEQVID